MPRVYNRRTMTAPPEAVYVGRGTPYGNPFVIGVHGNRAQVIALFKRKKASSLKFRALVKQNLRGKDLVCWCAPEACHAGVLLEIANRPKRDKHHDRN